MPPAPHLPVSNSPAYNLLIILLLTMLAALPRFYGLGSLGFYGDEETMALPSASLARGGGIQMPSGMPYERALPLTVMNAASARIFGLERELSYRLPAAIFGTLTVPLLFLLGRPLFGARVAFLAALLLAFSEWHIITSREARMYVPFLFFYLAAGFATWQWVKTGKIRYMPVAAALILTSVSFHTLGLFAVLFAIVPIAIKNWSRVSPLNLLLFAFLCGAAAHLYSQYFVSSAFDSWIQAQSSGTDTLQGGNSEEHGMLPESLAALPYSGVFAIVGALLGLWAGVLSRAKDNSPGKLLRLLAHYLTASISAAMASTGQVYAAVSVAVIFFLMHPEDFRSILGKIRQPALAICVLSTLSVLILIWDLGPLEGIKSLVRFPFPYPVYFGEMFPGVLGLFLVGTIALTVSPQRVQDGPFISSLLMVIVPMLAIGVAKQWGGIRYLIEAYPFLLVLAAFGLINILSIAGRRKTNNVKAMNAAYLTGIVIVASGILGGHGIPQAIKVATMSYGDSIDRYALGFLFYPDHKSPGLFVKQHMKPGDIVIAEDALQQYWYVGQVDYWLRDPAGSARYLYRGSDGLLHDIYVDSIAASNEILSTIDAITDRQIWVITSGETRHAQNSYLNVEQQHWLEALRKNNPPVFTGKDGVTRVYCLNCPTLDALKNTEYSPELSFPPLQYQNISGNRLDYSITFAFVEYRIDSCHA